MSEFKKDRESFPVKDEYIYLNNCGVAALYSGAARAAARFMDTRARKGVAVFLECDPIPETLHRSLGAFMRVDPADLSFVKNTAEGMSLIANGYPFEPGDEIISYTHEYPSNHYPWLLQERRGARLRLLGDHDPLGDLPANRPRAWSMAELEELVNKKTRLVALSHVQFTSGFAADLPALGAFCRERGLDLVVDVAQSLGALPVYPAQFGISAVAASGWKWLLGPVGCGVLYTAPEFREKIAVTMAGAEVVTQGDDYLNHTWQPHTDGRRFQYSTMETANAEALRACLEDLHAPLGADAIRAEIFRLQDRFIKDLDTDKYRVVLFPDAHRSGILSVLPRDGRDPALLSRELIARGVFCTSRGGYLRVGPHFYNDDEEISRAAEVFNEI